MTHLNITDLCNHHNRKAKLENGPKKLPAHFTKLNACVPYLQEIHKEKGVKGKTYIPEELALTFFRWLSPEYHELLDKNGNDWQSVYKLVRGVAYKGDENEATTS